MLSSNFALFNINRAVFASAGDNIGCFPKSFNGTANFSENYLKPSQVSPIEMTVALRKSKMPEMQIHVPFEKRPTDQFSWPRRLAAVIFAVAGLFAADAAHAERSYLSVVGAPPLRFQVLNTNHLYLSMKSFPPEPKPAADSDVATNLEADATNSTAASISSTNGSRFALNAPDAATSKTNPEMEGLTPDYLSSEEDLPTVTPQMISEYLKPERTQSAQQYKTGTVEFVPVEMQFAPPAPKSSGESRATYNSQ